MPISGKAPIRSFILIFKWWAIIENLPNYLGKKHLKVILVQACPEALA